MSNDKSQPVAIITGASSGIGQATALELARRGYAVVLAARRADRLEQVAQQCRRLGATATPVVTDVADVKQVGDLVAGAVDQFGRLDVMVNNAGFGLVARVHETTDQQMRDIFDTNFFGLFYGARAAARVMIPQRSGHIFNVASVLGKRGSPFNGAYSATKFAVCGLTDSMRVELKPMGVHVTCLCPAYTRTEFFDHVQGRRSPRHATAFKRFRGYAQPDVVARRLVRTIGRNVPQIVFSAGGKFLALVAALSPRLADVIMTVYGNALEKPDAIE